MSATTPPSVWRKALDGHRPRRLDLDGFGPVVVVAAHPDDETLAVSGVMQALHRAGTPVRLVVATDGEAAFPELDRSGRQALAQARRAELATALCAQGLAGVPVRWLGLPDSALDAETLADDLSGSLAEAESYLAPWPGDPHPDHVAAGRAAAAAAPVTTRGWSYPIWMWPWLDPGHSSIPWSKAFLHPLEPAARHAKRRALRAFDSQLAAAPGGGEPILTAAVLAHFEMDWELVFREPRSAGAPLERFADLYRHGDGDPWQTRRGWYERRKRAVLLACLPRERYRHAAEPGCGTGELTRELATRCERVTAADFSAEAVRMARQRTGELPGVTVTREPLPHGIPDGVDLVVLSEVLYYLSEADLVATRDRLVAALAPGADVVVAHWRGWPAEAPRDGAEVHRMLAEEPGLVVLVEHADEEFSLHVYRRR